MNLRKTWRRFVVWLKNCFIQYQTTSKAAQGDASLKNSVLGGFVRMKGVSEVAKDFNVVFKELTDEEDELRKLMTSYCTGGDVRMTDIDQSYARIKKHMRDIRKLAEQATQEKEEDDTTDKL